MTDQEKAIMQLKDIRDELEKIDTSFKGNTFERAMQICETAEQLHLAIHYINNVINKMIVLQFFEEKQRE